MLKRPTRARLASGAVLALVAGLLAGASATTVFTAPQAAHAAVASGDVVFSKLTPNGTSTQSYDLTLHKSNGSEVTLATGAQTQQTPDTSPDGSRIVYAWVGPGGGYRGIWVINSDGSGKTAVTHPDGSSNDMSLHFDDHAPRWSPNGQSVLFLRYNYGVNPYTAHIMKINSDGSGLADLTPTGSMDFGEASWSPDGARIAVGRTASSGQTQIWVMNADGSNLHLIDPTPFGCDNLLPEWSPDGSRIYVGHDCRGNRSIGYFTSTDGFASPTNAQFQTLVSNLINYDARVSADGRTIYYDNAGYVWSADTSTGAKTEVINDDPSGAFEPAPIKAPWPPVPPSNSTVAVGAPSSHDAPYTRQITIKLSSTGIQRFEYGWSSSSSTAPNMAYLQTTTDMSGKKGTLNFLGKYSGSGTIWNGGTQPDQDWYLWVRSVKTTGTANSWGTPLKVHTPKAPIWVGDGDSYSSGHHQDVDEPWCPDPSDTHYVDFQSYWNCPAGGTTVTPNDVAYSWVKQATDRLNSTLHAPPAWSYQTYLIASSGKPTSSFGTTGESRGSDAWATGATQSAYMRGYLYPQFSSWPVVSMTGGANDTNWASKLADFYSAHFVAGSPAPWSVTTANPSADCPDSQAVWDSLKAVQADGLTLDAQITANLQGMVSVASRYAPGVRMLNGGYPYLVDSTNSCFADSDSWHGSRSVIDDLNADHTAVTGSNVHYLNLTTSGGFGANPVSNNYLQLTRLYGYPHPAASGQFKMASLAATELTNTSW